MIKIYPYENLGHANHGWLNASHHFSFTNYYNPQRMNFGMLKVINDNIIGAGMSLSTNPHNNIRIITYVRNGAIIHKDSMGNIGKTEARNLQVMSTNSGVFYSEHNLENKDIRLYQIWIPQTKKFPKTFVPNNSQLPVLVSGRTEDKDKNTLFIYYNSAIYAGIMKSGDKVENNIKYQAYILALNSSFTVNSVIMKKIMV